MTDPLSPRKPAGGRGSSFDGELTAAGATLEDLFQNAALALSARFVDPVTVRPGGLRDRLRVEAPDAETLLLNWLKEISRQFYSNRNVIAAVRTLRISRLPPEGGGGEIRLDAEIDGELLDPGRHDVLLPAGPRFRSPTVQMSAALWSARIEIDA